jgi:hypothetical protein
MPTTTSRDLPFAVTDVIEEMNRPLSVNEASLADKASWLSTSITSTT